MFLKCSWFLLFKFHKNLCSSFSWFIFLKLVPLCRFYYFMMLRLSLFCSCWYLYLSLVIMRLTFLKTAFKSIVITFSMSLVFLKSIDMFLKCWIVLKFSFQKSLAALSLHNSVFVHKKRPPFITFIDLIETF